MDRGDIRPNAPQPLRSDQVDRVTAVLGPTNTGKTYLAIERMLGHASGMIGFPLRLLARENYDRIAKSIGVSKVALITGEERIIPPNPSYFVCTVESMPLDRPVRFMAIDEIQMAADAERGHFFTDRLLNARGLEETMLLGADTIRPLLQRLVPGAEYIARPRFSTLSYTGPKKITRLPRRSAVVGFSASEVYSIAELIRRQRGGAAVVMGALSPRTRNAQVEMFQNGDVDYIVATDAIGMGLNMDVGHVAFAGLRKFDGRTLRPLQAPELAQIAGRAGRHMNDGTFGTTAEIEPLDGGLVEQVENHRFDPLKALMWRNTDLDFASLARLVASLNVLPSLPGLQRVRESDDLMALVALASHDEIRRRAGSQQRVHLLWDVCQVPDFRKTMSEEHTKLLSQLFMHLTDAAERLPVDWVDRQIKRLERFDGDIDTLMSRIAHTRTWTYISNRSGWLDDAAGWQERTRTLEDRLSDALHERLMQRFVDRRTAMLVRRLKDQEDFMASVADSGDVNVEGQFLGRIDGFRFVPDTAASQGDQRAVMSAALRVLRQDMPARLQRFAEAPDGEFEIMPDLRIGWRGAAVAYLQPGSDILAPKIEVLPSDLLDGPSRELVRKRAADWLNGLIAKHLAELIAGRDADIGPAARGVMFQLAERLGVMPRPQIEAQLTEIDETARKALARLGARVGIYTLYLPTMLKPAAIKTRALLWAVWHGKQAMPALPVEGRTSIDMAGRDDREFLAAMGYLPLGRHAIRADMLERLAAAGRHAVRHSRDAHDAYRRAASAYAAANPAPEAVSGGIEVPTELSSDVVTQGEGMASASNDAVSVNDHSAATAEASIPATANAATSADVTIDASQEAVEEVLEMSSPVCYAGEFETPKNDATGSDAISGSGSDAIAAMTLVAEAPVVEAPAEKKPEAPPEAPVAPALPSGHFRATPEMMSYVGCSEAEMADILRDLGYRVHPPAEPEGPHSFSLVPRRTRDNQHRPNNGHDNRNRPPANRQHANRPHDERPHGENRGRGQQQAPAPSGDAVTGEAVQAGQTQQQEQHHEQPRPNRPQGDRPQQARPHQDRRQDQPRQDQPGQDAPSQQNKPRGDDERRHQQARGDKPRNDQSRGPRKEGPRNEGRRDQKRDDRRDGRRDDKRGDRRRDDNARPERVVSTGPAVESPFAKLKDLGLFK
ncbi:MAG: helicase-related protein [Rhodospirillales bacterium]